MFKRVLPSASSPCSFKHLTLHPLNTIQVTINPKRQQALVLSKMRRFNYGAIVLNLLFANRSVATWA